MGSEGRGWGGSEGSMAVEDKGRKKRKQEKIAGEVKKGAKLMLGGMKDHKLLKSEHE